MNAKESVSALGGNQAVATGTGVPRSAVVCWGRRNSIPVKHWPKLLKMAVEVGQSRVTVDSLYQHQAASEDVTAINQAAA